MNLKEDFEEILIKTEVDVFLKELPSLLKINYNKEGKNNIPFRFVGMLGQGSSILRKIKFKEAVNLIGPFNSSLQKIVESTTINLGKILPTILTYNHKIQNHLDKIENHISHFGIPHYDLFTPTILSSYSNFKKEVIVGLEQLKNSGLNDTLCEQAKNLMVETINDILKQIRRYYFWSLCATKTKNEIKDEKIFSQIVKTYTSTVQVKIK
jgi:hypothetical protein